ncbi:MAG: GntR family transcriptional regulator, partial [Candidatus Binatia bacterium]
MTERIADRLRKALEDEIVTGRLAPGARLDEVSLATRFAVSRTPIREALNQLSTSGLIQMRPRRGAIVNPVTTEDLVEMFET